MNEMSIEPTTDLITKKINMKLTILLEFVNHY